MRVLVAPDKFKDALSAQEAAAAIAAGVRDARPDSEIDICPMADGGDGTGAILAAAMEAEPRETTVLDPLGRPRRATWWLSRDAASAVIEMAQASGLALLDSTERDPLRTSSFGTGQLLRTALEAGAERILLCVGGSATVDGGAGCLQALGWRFFDEDEGHIVVPLTGGTLDLIRTMQPPAWSPRFELTILADVDNPLLGRDGAAVAFGPQKGASPAVVEQLEANLKDWAHVLAMSRNVLVHAMRGGGAAGGLPAGLMACAGGQCQAGFDKVAEQVKLRERMRAAALCITGEGRLDSQTVRGKVLAGIGSLAREVDTPAIAMVGAVALRDDEAIARVAESLGLADVITISPAGTPIEMAMRETAVNLRRATARHLGRRG